MRDFIAAIDQGTTSTRFVIFDHSGRVVAFDQKEHRQIYPQPGWVEHDPIEILENTHRVIEGAISKAKINTQDIVAVGVANQRETTVIWDRATGKPIHNALVWQDTRTAEICADLARASNESPDGRNRFRQKVGLPISTYFSGPKIKWLLDNVKDARARALNGELLFGNIDTWLIWNLTGGVHVTDVTNASRTMLMGLSTLEWDYEILREMTIPHALLPDIKSSAQIYGTIGGRLSGIPLAGDLGDQQAALFGQTCFSPGEAKNTYGTGCFLLLNTGRQPVQSKSGLITTLGYRISNQPAVYCLEGSIAVAGALVQWLRDNLGLIDRSEEIESLARSVKDNAGIYFVPAFSGLFAPYWREDARGAIVGMTRFVNRGHIARAALEATAYQTRELVDAMNLDSSVALSSLKVDGGMVKNELLMQFQSDLLGVRVIRPAVTETTALGAAYAAGLAVGFWKDYSDLRANWEYGKEWTPRMDLEVRERLYSGWKKAVTKTFDWASRS